LQRGEKFPFRRDGADNTAGGETYPFGIPNSPARKTALMGTGKR